VIILLFVYVRGGCPSCHLSRTAYGSRRLLRFRPLDTSSLHELLRQLPFLEEATEHVLLKACSRLELHDWGKPAHWCNIPCFVVKVNLPVWLIEGVWRNWSIAPPHEPFVTCRRAIAANWIRSRGGFQGRYGCCDCRHRPVSQSLHQVRGTGWVVCVSQFVHR
jgi:hypothetical protein